MKEVTEDADILEDSFEEWEKMMEESKKKMKNAGIRYKKVYIKTEEYVKYCRNKSLPLNTESRSIYVAELLKNEDN